MPDVELHLGDCLDILPTLADASVDCVVTDPPYPCIKRSYGTWTEAEWFALMDVVVPECRRILKPTGSAVFILQPNSERAGRMRPWLWEFMAKWTRDWGMVQDAWWWNINALPCGASITHDLLRTSVKACVWLGPAECFRDQSSVLWRESDENANRRRINRALPARMIASPSGHVTNRGRITSAAERRGGTTPFNMIPIRGTTEFQSGAAGGHSALTPDDLASWWLRYICPPGGMVLDPFLGSGTTALAAIRQGKSCVGIERITDYHAIATRRIAAAHAECPLFTGPAPESP